MPSILFAGDMVTEQTLDAVGPIFLFIFYVWTPLDTVA